MDIRFHPSQKDIQKLNLNIGNVFCNISTSKFFQNKKIKKQNIVQFYRLFDQNNSKPKFIFHVPSTYEVHGIVIKSSENKTLKNNGRNSEESRI